MQIPAVNRNNVQIKIPPLRRETACQRRAIFSPVASMNSLVLLNCATDKHLGITPSLFTDDISLSIHFWRWTTAPHSSRLMENLQGFGYSTTLKCSCSAHHYVHADHSKTYTKKIRIKHFKKNTLSCSYLQVDTFPPASWIPSRKTVYFSEVAL